MEIYTHIPSELTPQALRKLGDQFLTPQDPLGVLDGREERPAADDGRATPAAGS
jgi:hypothetical protein